MEKAQVGDLIRMLITEDGWFKKGDILEVVDVDEYEDGATASNGVILDIPVNNKEYVIHRKAGEEDSAEVDDLLHEHYSDMAEESVQDAVNSPTHYTQGKFETIEIIEEITKGYSDGYVAYCVGNALKYLARAPFKHGEPSEDLAKADAYIRFASEYLDAKSTRD